MIVKLFNNGWGDSVPLKKFENSLIGTMLGNDTSRTVLISSVWYSQEYHQQVLAELKQLQFDQIVLVAMLDPAIPYPDWYSEFNCKVVAIGYYPGQHNLDFFALVIDKYFEPIDTDILLDANTVDTAYMCLNRKPHWHRIQLYKQLVSQDVVDCGLVSMGGEGHAIRLLEQDREHDNLAPNATREHYGIPNDIASVGHMGNWKRHLVNVVTETVYDINRAGFVSEKIFKPIVGCRPFLIYAPDGAVNWLTSKGFEPYVRDFGDITDLDLSKPESLAPFLKTLCGQPQSYLQKKLVDLKHKIMYNKFHFADYVQQQKLIVNKGI